mmetsp:Transcript_8965/g.26873  ORF Transcript_8965/g.26873 Transcript_8965/m.26873 type:complete len:202 (+) Transcript_8965:935-1540(+)
MLCAINGSLDGSTSHGDENVLGSDGARATGCQLHLNGVWVLEAAKALNELHASILQQAIVHAVQPCNLLGLLLNQAFPVEAGLSFNFPSKTTSIGKLIPELRPIYEQFLRNTATNDTRAPSATMFLIGDEGKRQLDDGHLRSVVGSRKPGSPGAATARANHHQVEVILPVCCLPHGIWPGEVPKASTSGVEASCPLYPRCT